MLDKSPFKFLISSTICQRYSAIARGVVVHHTNSFLLEYLAPSTKLLVNLVIISHRHTNDKFTFYYFLDRFDFKAT